MSTHDYRPEIDGLRALAVIPVVLYHVGFGGLAGGYFGVDVFFVISGFLISGIVLDEAARGEFAYRRFYERRARRLLPALFTVIIATFVASWFVLLPEDYLELSTSSIWTLLFGSNFFFLDHVNYYSQEAELMPLLHTWSLAVEEQFYLVWPPILIGCAWIGRRYGWKVAVVPVFGLVLLSMIMCEVRVDEHTEAVFYMTWYRFWELGVGALAAIAVRRGVSVNGIPAIVIFAVGAALVCVAMFWDGTSNGTRLAILVLLCTGTAAMLLTGRDNPAARVFTLGPVVAVGRMSYSIYLWHWPVLALFRVYQGETAIAAGDALWLLALISVLAAASYRFVEQPMRRMPSRRSFATRAIGMAAVSALAVVIAFGTGGYQSRIGDRLDYVADRSVMSRWPCESQPVLHLGKLCVLGAELTDNVPVYVLWGDSHAHHLAPLVDRVARERDIAVVMYLSCTPSIDNVHVQYLQEGEAHSKKCGRWRDRGLSWLNWTFFDVKGVIVAGAWAGQRGALRSIGPNANPNLRAPELTALGLNSFIDRVGKNRSVLLLSDVPRLDKSLLECAYSDLPRIARRSRAGCGPLSGDYVRAKHAPTTDALKQVAQARSNVEALDLVEGMCGTGDCPLFIEDRILYRDHNHIRSNLTDREIETLVARIGLREAFGRLVAAN